MSLRGMYGGVGAPTIEAGRGGGGVVVMLKLRGKFRGCDEKMT